MLHRSMIPGFAIAFAMLRQVENGTATAASQEKAFSLDNIEKTYFSPTELDKAAALIEKIRAIPNAMVRDNMDNLSKPVPDGFGLLILPIQKRATDGRETIGVSISAVPDIETVAAHENGPAFIQDAVISAYAVKIGNATRPRKDGSVAGSMPESLEDFIESRKGRESFKTYSEIAPDIIKALKKKGLKNINAPTLRQILQSRQFAEQHYEKIPQDQWQKVLDTMIAVANQQKLDPAVLINWRDTRDQVEVTEVEDVDFGDLGDLIAKDKEAA